MRTLKRSPSRRIIARRAAEIREGWSAAERAKRAANLYGRPIETAAYGFTYAVGRSGVMEPLSRFVLA